MVIPDPSSALLDLLASFGYLSTWVPETGLTFRVVRGLCEIQPSMSHPAWTETQVSCPQVPVHVNVSFIRYSEQGLGMS